MRRMEELNKPQTKHMPRKGCGTLAQVEKSMQMLLWLSRRLSQMRARTQNQICLPVLKNFAAATTAYILMKATALLKCTSNFKFLRWLKKDGPGPADFCDTCRDDIDVARRSSDLQEEKKWIHYMLCALCYLRECCSNSLSCSFFPQYICSRRSIR